ncbi:hypothetical protein [Pantoea ananatis]|uniref:hypothetical protein n=1 Tax=Pantoea ananas TaxID=553 RepID=UPI001B317E3F|nr:hypothetical protein [Pantoea ananatis]
MIYSNIQTRYITSTKNNRLVRYDLIVIDEDTYVVKVWDDQQRGLSKPGSIIELDSLEFTRADYKAANGMGGFPRSVSSGFPVSFEGHVLNKCQEHRDSLAD